MEIKIFTFFRKYTRIIEYVNEELKDNAKWNSLSDRKKQIMIGILMTIIVTTIILITFLSMIAILFSRSLLIKWLGVA